MQCASKEICVHAAFTTPQLTADASSDPARPSSASTVHPRQHDLISAIQPILEFGLSIARPLLQIMQACSGCWVAFLILTHIVCTSIPCCTAEKFYTYQRILAPQACGLLICPGKQLVATRLLQLQQPICVRKGLMLQGMLVGKVLTKADVEACRVVLPRMAMEANMPEVVDADVLHVVSIPFVPTSSR